MTEKKEGREKKVRLEQKIKISSQGLRNEIKIIIERECAVTTN